MSDLSNALKALRIANKRIDELEKYNLDLANESHNKSSRIERLQQRINELEAQLPEWVSVDERLPEIDYSRPECSRYIEIDVICSEGKTVRQLRYISNAYAKTEKGREPRFEELNGIRAFMKPTHWMPLPQPPKEQDDE